MSVKIGSFKGKATITLNAESKYPFTFGVTKALAILENLDAIRSFVVANACSKPTPSAPAPAYKTRTDGGYSSGLDDRIADQYAEQCGLNGDGR